MNPPEYQVGDKLVFLKMNAIIRYIGPYHDQPGQWIGLEVDVPKGKNNGTIKGKKYFECEPNHGFFVQYNVFLKALHNPVKDMAKPKPHEEVNTQAAPSLSAMVPSKSNDALNSGPRQRRLSNSVSMAAELNQLDTLAQNNEATNNANQTAAKQPPLPSRRATETKLNLSIKPSQPQSNQNQSSNQNQAPINQNSIKQNQVQPNQNQTTSQPDQTPPSKPTETQNQPATNQNSSKPTETQNLPRTNQPATNQNSSKPTEIQNSPRTNQIQTDQNQSATSNQNQINESLTNNSNQEATTTNESKSSEAKKSTSTPNPEKVQENLALQCKMEFEKLQQTAAKVKEIQSRMKTEEDTYKAQMKQMEDNFHEDLAKLELKYLPEQIRLENELLRYTKNEKIAKKKAMSRYTHKTIELLQEINEEHIKFENSYRELIQKQSAKFNSKKKQFNLLEIKLKTQYDTSNDQDKKISELNEKINAYQKELTEKLPVSKESADLNIKITSHQSMLDRLNRLNSIYESDCKIGNELFQSIKDLFGPIVPALNVVYRLIEKVSYQLSIPREDIEKSTLEDIYHICETTILVLERNNNKFTDDFQYFIDELNSIEMNIDNEIIPTIDPNHLMSLLQSITPLSLNLALSSHLFKALMYRLQSSDARDELRNFSKQFNRIFHPCQMLKNKEECEKFTLIIRSELRKAENKKPFSLMKFLNPLQTLLSYQSKDDYGTNPKSKNSSNSQGIGQNIKMIATEELILANKAKERKAIEEEEQGLSELRRQVADLESTYDQLARYNEILTELTKTIPDEIVNKEEEISVAEELLQTIEAEKLEMK